MGWVHNTTYYSGAYAPATRLAIATSFGRRSLTMVGPMGAASSTLAGIALVIMLLRPSYSGRPPALPHWKSVDLIALKFNHIWRRAQP